MQLEPIATYRLQLRPEFGFQQTSKLINYLSELGISHLYTSPFLQAIKDSTHGYDVVDPTKINTQLGSAGSLQELFESVKQAGLGLMVDVVPNHMAIEGRQNPWWWDVLENGASSHFSTYFDIDWVASEELWDNKIYLPVLEDHYGCELEKGALQLKNQRGEIVLSYQNHLFPVDPSTLGDLLRSAAVRCGSKQLVSLAEGFENLQKGDRRSNKTELSHLLAKICQEQPAVNQAVNNEIQRLNQDVDALDALISLQNYRLAFWRSASRELGYRRFFDIKDLVGLRIENQEVFLATHALPISWFREGWVQGLRIDHPDGLRDPAGYFKRLQEACPGAWVVAEKILTPGEKLPSEWRVQGTTGYDFISLSTSLLVDPRGKKTLTTIYQDIVGAPTDFKALVRCCKRKVLKELLGSELNRLMALFVEICRKHRRHRDYTNSELREALSEVAECFPVYRTYVEAARNHVSSEDEKYVFEAVALAKRLKPHLDGRLFDFLKELLLLRVKGALEGELAMRFQQLTGPVMAKGFEDTALYRYNRLLALNDVGLDPENVGISLKAFHEACREGQIKRPLSLLASTTHDTKRSEDVRARLAVLSEIPEEWGKAVQRWIVINEKYRSGETPDRNMEYHFYQTLAGAWPIEADRLIIYMEKAMREAKEHTSWIQPHAAYESEVIDFVRDVLQDRQFLADFEPFAAALVLPGRINSLTQTLIKLTVPGVPDIYQGCELWNLSLVDPDNRREVDFVKRRQLLDGLKKLSTAQIMARMDEGLPKLWLIKQALNLRKRKSALFGVDGTCHPLYAKGQKAEHVVAFMRREEVVSIAPRFPVRLKNEWADTTLELPKGEWQNILSGKQIQGGIHSMRHLFADFPVCLLEKNELTTP